MNRQIKSAIAVVGAVLITTAPDHTWLIRIGASVGWIAAVNLVYFLCGGKP